MRPVKNPEVAHSKEEGSSEMVTEEVNSIESRTKQDLMVNVFTDAKVLIGKIPLTFAGQHLSTMSPQRRRTF